MRALDETRPLRGTCTVPGDKSISHRAILLASLTRGTSRIAGLSPAEDCAATLRVPQVLGGRVERRGGDVSVTGPPRPPSGDLGVLDCGRSGTTMRLAAGVLAGFPVVVTMTGHAQLLARPMSRVAEPLRAMGATIDLVDGEHPPVAIAGGSLRAISYRLPVASAQVKSAVLLAGLRADGTTIVVEPVPTRDHTERLLVAMGARITLDDAPGSERTMSVAASDMEPLDLAVPGDLSSAAFLLAAAALVAGSDLTVDGVGLNPTRTGFLEVLSRMGAALEVEATGETAGGEPFGRIRIRPASLRASSIVATDVPLLIDELPLVALVATQAEGTTEVHGAGELRVKESDRIGGLVRGLRTLGASVEELEDGFAVTGPTPLGGGRCDALGDHRLAMTFAVAGLIASGPVEVDGARWVGDSFPGFDGALQRLLADGHRT